MSYGIAAGLGLAGLLGLAAALDQAGPDDDGLTDRTRSREHAALEAELDRRRREEAVEAQLAELKRRAGRQ